MKKVWSYTQGERRGRVEKESVRCKDMKAWRDNIGENWMKRLRKVTQVGAWGNHIIRENSWSQKT